MSLFRKKRRDLASLKRTEWELLIDENILGKNSFRDREMLKDHILDGKTYEYLAEKNGISSRQVARIIPKRMEQLQKII